MYNILRLIFLIPFQLVCFFILLAFELFLLALDIVSIPLNIIICLIATICFLIENKNKKDFIDSLKNFTFWISQNIFYTLCDLNSDKEYKDAFSIGFAKWFIKYIKTDYKLPWKK
jgi:ABC-type bacteriocin/lantibiotic exporter with double-glycine peptidase domain